MTGTIVLLGTGALARLDSLLRIRELGHHVTLVRPRGDAPRDDEGAADLVVRTDLSATDVLLSDVVARLAEHALEPVAVAAFTEFCAVQAAALADFLGLPGPGAGAVRTARNKFLTKTACRGLGAYLPDFRLVRTEDDVRAFLADGDGPVVLKPVNAAGAYGVALLEVPGDVAPALAGFRRDQERERAARSGVRCADQVLLVERYVDGIEVSVESLTHRGRTVTFAIHDKWVPVEGPYFLEQYFVTPSPRIGPETEAAIVRATAAVLDRIGFRDGVTHVEFRVRAGKPYLVEVNPRPGGRLVVDSVYHSTGVNLVEAHVRSLLGEEPPLPAGRVPAASRCLYPQEGTLARITGLARAGGHPFVKVVDVQCRAGDVVHRKGLEAGVNLLASDPGTSAAELVGAVDAAAAAVRFGYR